ncbi:MAG: hypothetical protein IPG72_05495 [Ardenticatenales bacterium]|nr:hypothetical protein [Ardenticatenales bacterium]
MRRLPLAGSFLANKAARYIRVIALACCALAFLALGAPGGASTSAVRAQQQHGAPDSVQEAQALGATIVVNTTDQEVNSDADCSLQEAIFAANFDAAVAINPNSLNGPKITTGCTPGSGADTIVLAANAVYTTNGSVASGVQNGVAQDQFNPAGLTATPSVTSTITIQGNGARFERTAGTVGVVRAFMVNQQVGLEVSHAQGNLTIQNLHIKGFKAQGGPGSDGGGGGMGAGGAIYVRNGILTVENSTFEANNATGGAGAAVTGTAGGGGGGGMSTSSMGGNDVAVGAGNGGGGGGGARGRGGNGPNSGGGGGGTALNGVDGSAGGVGGNGGFNCGGKGGDFPNNAANNGFCSGGAGGGGAQGTGAGVNGGAGGNGNYGGAGGGGGASSQANGGSGGNGGFGGGGGAGAVGTSNGGSGGYGAGGGARGSTGGTAGVGGFFGVGGNVGPAAAAAARGSAAPSSATAAT